MSDFATLASALASFYTRTDTGAGAPKHISGHEADRLATLPRRESRPPRRRTRLGTRRPA